MLGNEPGATRGRKKKGHIFLFLVALREMRRGEKENSNLEKGKREAKNRLSAKSVFLIPWFVSLNLYEYQILELQRARGQLHASKIAFGD